jgi:ABC-type multidrug transport system fused ATPase/permease subunit
MIEKSHSRHTEKSISLGYFSSGFSLLSVVAVVCLYFGAKRGDTNKKSRLAASLTLDLTHVLCLLLIFLFILFPSSSLRRSSRLSSQLRVFKKGSKCNTLDVYGSRAKTKDKQASKARQQRRRRKQKKTYKRRVSETSDSQEYAHSSLCPLNFFWFLYLLVIFFLPFCFSPLHAFSLFSRRGEIVIDV